MAFSTYMKRTMEEFEQRYAAAIPSDGFGIIRTGKRSVTLIQELETQGRGIQHGVRRPKFYKVLGKFKNEVEAIIKVRELKGQDHASQG